MRNIIRTKLNIFLALAFCLNALCGTTLAQSGDKVLVEVAGIRSLKQSDVNKSIEVFEFFFAKKFSALQRAEYQEYIENEWRGERQQTIKDITALAELQPALKKASAEKRAELREQFLPELIKLLEDNSDTTVYSYLLSIYRGAESESETSAALNSENNTKNEVVQNNRGEVLKNSGTMKDLVGKWERKQSGQSYVNQNGTYAGSSGNYESYTFYADGRVDYTSLIAVQNYGCRLEAFAQRKGRAQVSGSTLTVNLTSGTVRRDDSCSPSKNYTKQMPSSTTDSTWSIERDEYGTVQLILTEPNGNKYYYRKAQ